MYIHVGLSVSFLLIFFFLRNELQRTRPLFYFFVSKAENRKAVHLFLLRIKAKRPLFIHESDVVT